VGASIRASWAILACSPFTEREIRGRFGAARVVHVPLGAADDLPPAAPREEARRRLGIRGPFLLAVGSIFNRRHPRELIRAVGLLRPRCPDVLLDIVGDNRTSPLMDLGSLVNELDLHDHVRLSGFVSEESLAERYAAADVCLYLSEYEGFGLPALEALTRGIPLLTSPQPALGELFGSASLLAEPQDVRGIAEALERLVTDRTLRASLVSAGRLLSSRFSWREAARKAREVIAEAAQG
jgi:glycosyltransferase involved in cell wall biosynthesis